MLDPKHFRNLLSNPETTVEEDLEKLEQLLDAHPYLQSARALQLKIFKQKNSNLYNDALRKTAAYTTDRDVLFQFITSEPIPSKEKDQQEVIPSDFLEIETSVEESKKETETPAKDEQVDKKEVVMSIEEVEELETAEQDAAETTLELNQPLSFSKHDSYSFTEWLQLTNRKPIIRGKEEKEVLDSKSEEPQEISKAPKTDKVIHLVDAFLKNNPRPKRKAAIYEEDTADLQVTSETPKSLMTETLARVYLQQKNYLKAIQAYKILILKNPKKSGYFADKIRAIEKLTNKK